MLNVIGNLVQYFTLVEMANNEDGGKLKLTPEAVRQAVMMNELRKWYNKSMKVNSWYRSKEYNIKVGGDPNSCHLDGIATDISLPHLTAKQITNFINKWKSICKKYGVIGGVSIYDTFLHFDSNNTPTRYNGYKPNYNFRVTDFR